MQDRFKLDISLTKTYEFDITVLSYSPQLIKFKLLFGKHEMVIEKRLLERQPWNVAAANFKFTDPNAAKNFNIICQHLDDAINGPQPPRANPKNY